MALFLVQHGQAHPKEVDSTRGLTEEGKKITHTTAEQLQIREVDVTHIIHSDKKRAIDTAKIFAEALHPLGGLTELDTLSPNHEVSALGDSLHNNNTMIVGHLPYLHHLCAYLICGTSEVEILKFQNSGVVCLDRDTSDSHWYIKWTLFPIISN
ncbi:MAG: phosphohistidine phosphatase SixA [Fibrobacterales bacterium]